MRVGHWQADIVRVDQSCLRGWQVVGCLIVVLWVGISFIILNRPLDTQSVKVAAIQPKVSTSANAMLGNDELMQQTLERMKAQIQEAAAMGLSLPCGLKVHSFGIRKWTTKLTCAC